MWLPPLQGSQKHLERLFLTYTSPDGLSTDCWRDGEQSPCSWGCSAPGIQQPAPAVPSSPAEQPHLTGREHGLAVQAKWDVIIWLYRISSAFESLFNRLERTYAKYVLGIEIPPKSGKNCSLWTRLSLFLHEVYCN